MQAGTEKIKSQNWDVRRLVYLEQYISELVDGQSVSLK
jgi:hypothetical protein